MPRTASRVRGSGCRRRAGARLLLAGDNTFEDGLGIIHVKEITSPITGARADNTLLATRPPH